MQNHQAFIFYSTDREESLNCASLHLQKQPLAPKELANHFRQKMCGYSWLFPYFSDDRFAGSVFMNTSVAADGRGAY